ncbi:hypothetical protein D3C71_1399380 [compost metagenome]
MCSQRCGIALQPIGDADAGVCRQLLQRGKHLTIGKTIDARQGFSSLRRQPQDLLSGISRAGLRFQLPGFDQLVQHAADAGFLQVKYVAKLGGGINLAIAYFNQRMHRRWRQFGSCQGIAHKA